MIRIILIIWVVSLVYFCTTPERPFNEILLSESENAYNPIPNRDGRLIAYVRTGWDREGGSGGTGRSNLRSEVMVMGSDGTLITQEPIGDAFLSGWSADDLNLVCYRDGQYFILSVDGRIKTKGRIPNTEDYPNRTERVSYLPGLESLVWSQNEDYGAFIQTPLAPIAKSSHGLGEMIIPSPDGRYIAFTGAQKSKLHVYDLQNDSWSNLGSVTIHPHSEWDYIKPSWNPWFSDSSRLAFISGSALVIVTPDGQNRQIVTDVGNKAGLAVPSPNGQLVAYATFEDRPRKMREDLKFWGNSTLWVISTTTGAKPYSVTGKNQDTTYCLRWLSDNQLVFDRIADEPFYRKSRIWKAEVPR